VTRALAWLAGLVVLAAVCAAFAPAALVGALVAEATRGELRLANARGTAWNGAADVVAADGRWTVPATWRLDALPLLRGEARVALRPPEGAAGARADVVARGGRIEAHDVAVDIPAASLRMPPGVLAGGEVRLRADSLVHAPERNEGSVRVEWTRARLALPAVGSFDLGTVSATLAGDGATWRGPVQARGGVLVVDGEARIDRAGSDLRLAVVPQPDAPPLLRAALGVPDAQGVVRLDLRGRFR
jgi:hypothetical protein